jgi:acyl-coenzyme A synthetase/AMP-(fatty) acid ligase
VPRFVRVVDTIPRNRTGKVDKVGLRSALAAELDSRRRRGGE